MKLSKPCKLSTILMASLSVVAYARAVEAQDVPAAPAKPHNVIIFVADGLRSGIVTKDNAPAIAAVRSQGVDFHNSHSVYPTVTTVNASAIATGHGIGDTGEFANNMYLGMPALKAAYNSMIGDMEDDGVLLENNRLYNGNYLDEVSLLAAARAGGFNTAAIGKEGPVLIQDLAASDGKSTIIIDDETGLKLAEHVPLSDDMKAAIKAAGIAPQAPDRGLNGYAGAYNMPGVIVPNKQQQDWFVAMATQVVLPKFAAEGKPFALVYWSRDPDGTQHYQGDSLNTLIPGINGPTSMAAIHNASDNLQALIDSLKKLGLYDTTDIVVTADHGFGVISKQSKTAAAVKMDFATKGDRDTIKGYLPLGYVAIDLANALGLKIWDASGLEINLKGGFHPHAGTAMGADPRHPDVLLVSGGGSDIIYLDPAKAKVLGPKIIAALTKQDYVGGLFADDSLGDIPGALKFSDIGLIGSAKTPRPAIYVSFKSFATKCPEPSPELCAAIVADVGLQQGQGTHGSLSRAESHNFMAAMGPDFKAGFVDQSPISNADIAPTLAHILGLTLPAKGHLTGRVVAEALPGGPTTTASAALTKRSQPAPNGFVTVLEAQTVGDEVYFDAAGKPGRVVGLKAEK